MIDVYSRINNDKFLGKTPPFHHKNTIFLLIVNYLVHVAHPYSKSLRCHRPSEHQTLLHWAPHHSHFQRQAMDPRGFYHSEPPFDCVTFASSAPMHSDARPAPSGSEPVMFQNNTNNIEHRAITTLIKRWSMKKTKVLNLNYKYIKVYRNWGVNLRGERKNKKLKTKLSTCDLTWKTKSSRNEIWSFFSWVETDVDYFKQLQFSCPSEEKFERGGE